jgi:hypothetical protein
MNKLEKIGAALAVCAAGCGGTVEGAPKDMGLVMDGYAISCNYINNGKTPFQVNHYCGSGQQEATIGPSVYADHSGKFRDAFNCVFQGLLHFETQKVQEAPQMDMSFIGGMSQGQAGSEQGGRAFSFPNGQFYSYIADVSPTGQPHASCQVLVAGLHEAGHGLINKALPQRNFSDYGLDEHGQDPQGSQTIMEPIVMCYPTLKFSEATARIIEQNLHPENPQPERLQNIGTRCAAEITAVTDLPTPVPGE